MLRLLIIFMLTVCVSTCLQNLTNNTCHDKIKTIEFYIYTRENKDEPKKIKIDDNSTYTNFNANQDTQILIHDFEGDPKQMYRNKDAILEMDDYNVIMVNWSVTAVSNGSFTSLSDCIKIVGLCLKTFIMALENERGLNVPKLHVVGYGAGAHIAGFTGTLFNRTIGRITGLDPRSYGFDNNNGNNLYKLDKSDAACVQIVHTHRLGFNVFHVVAHGNFFPNGGIHQPGCSDELSIKDDCSHERVLDLHLGWTRNPGMYIGVQNSKSQLLWWKVLMANGIPEGMFYLRTTDSPPYEQIRIKPRKG